MIVIQVEKWSRMGEPPHLECIVLLYYVRLEVA